MHHAVWRDGREVAVKLQYPGAAQALAADLNQIGRLGRLIGPLLPGLDFKPLLTELRERILEEVDYAAEAAHQRIFAAAYADNPEIFIGRVVASAPALIVTEWVEGRPLSSITADGSRSERDERMPPLVYASYSWRMARNTVRNLRDAVGVSPSAAGRSLCCFVRRARRLSGS